MLYADFESILKPADERYRDRMDTMKAEIKDKAPYTEKINTQVPSGCTFASSYCANQRFVLALLIYINSTFKNIFSNNKEKLKLQTSQKCSFGIVNLKKIEKMIWKVYGISRIMFHKFELWLGAFFFQITTFEKKIFAKSSLKVNTR